MKRRGYLFSPQLFLFFKHYNGREEDWSQAEIAWLYLFAMVKGDCAGTEFLSMPQGTVSNLIMDLLAVAVFFLFILFYCSSPFYSVKDPIESQCWNDLMENTGRDPKTKMWARDVGCWMHPHPLEIQLPNPPLRDEWHTVISSPPITHIMAQHYVWTMSIQ